MGLDVNEATRLHFDRIHRAALVLTGNPWDAEDLAQETFLLLARKPDSFKGNSSLYTWLYGVLLNLDRRHRRRRGTWRRKFRVLCENQSDRAQTTPAAETPIEVAEWKSGLWAKVAQLPDGQRQTLVLRFSEGLQYHEIAQSLDCPLGTVKSRIYHGLLALRRLIEDEGGDIRKSPQHPYEDLVHAI